MAQSYSERVGDRGEVLTANGANVILGAWLIVSPAFFITTAVSYWNNVLVGMAVVVFAGLRVMIPRASTRVLSWVNVVLGIWLVFSPFILDYGMGSVVWNDVIVGILLAVLASWGASRPKPAAVGRCR